MLLLIDRYQPDLIFLNEAKLRKSELFDLNNKSQFYKFYSLLPEDVAKDHEEIMQITRKGVQKGLLIGTRRDDPTTIKVLPKTNNSHFMIIRDNIIFGNIYLPQRKLGSDLYEKGLDAIRASILQNRVGQHLFLVGDYNLGETQGPKRHKLIKESFKDMNLIKLEPDVPTNYNFCGAETTIDYAYHSPELKCDLQVIDHESFPLNTSSHVPILYEVIYEKEILPDNIQPIQDKYIPDPTLRPKTDAPIYIPHKKIKEGRFDEELYKRKSQIYVALALEFGSDMNSCELLSLIGQMLAMAADRSMIKIPRKEAENKILLKNARYHERKIKGVKKYLQRKREKILGEFHLLSRKDLVEMGLQRHKLRALDKHTDIFKKKLKDAKDIHTKMKIERAEELHRKLNKAIRMGDSKLFAQVIKKKEKSVSNTTNKLTYKGHTYLNKDVLKGFAEKALDESEDPMTVEGVEISREYLDMRNERYKKC